MDNDVYTGAILLFGGGLMAGIVVFMALHPELPADPLLLLPVAFMVWFGYLEVKDAIVEPSKKAFERYREINQLKKFERFTNTVQSLGGDTIPVEFLQRGNEIELRPVDIIDSTEKGDAQ